MFTAGWLNLVSNSQSLAKPQIFARMVINRLPRTAHRPPSSSSTCQYILNEKEEEVKVLNDLIRDEEEAIHQAETRLEMDTQIFEEFLQARKQASMEASEKAEQAIRAKQDKTQEVKRLQSYILDVKSEIAKYEEILQELNGYETFLRHLMKTDLQSTTDPNELLAAYNKMRQNNMHWLKMVHQRRRVLEDLEDNSRSIREKIDQATANLSEKLKELKARRDEGRQKLCQLEESKRSLLKEATNPKNEARLVREVSLSSKITQVYEVCLKENEAKLGPIDLLQELENTLQDLMDAVDKLPQDRVKSLQKSRIRHRLENIRRSKLVAPRSEDGCLRCKEKTKNEPSKKTES